MILSRSARIHGLEVAADAIRELARCSRGTPRTANRLLAWVRDYAMTRGDGRVSRQTALEALRMQGVDEQGLDEFDRKYLRTIIDYYEGGPAGIETIAATLNEQVDNLVDSVEPYLLKIGFVARTSRGRVVTETAYRHLGIALPRSRQGNGKGGQQPGLFQ